MLMFAFSSLVLYDKNIVGFHALKESIIGIIFFLALDCWRSNTIKICKSPQQRRQDKSNAMLIPHLPMTVLVQLSWRSLIRGALWAMAWIQFLVRFPWGMKELDFRLSILSLTVSQQRHFSGEMWNIIRYQDDYQSALLLLLKIPLRYGDHLARTERIYLRLGKEQLRGFWCLKLCLAGTSRLDHSVMIKYQPSSDLESFLVS